MGHQTRERAWNEIERRIVCGELASGAVLDEDGLATDLGVETPVVRGFRGIANGGAEEAPPFEAR